MNVLKKSFFVLSLSFGLLLSGCGYNALQAQDEDTAAKWSEVVNQYQRRADLVPNLVTVVERYARHEQEVLTEVAEARSRVGSIQVTPETLNNPENLKAYQEAQGQMTLALGRLKILSEQYPTLKADALFQDLQAQLEGTENRIAVARKDYIDSIQAYNSTVRQFPTNLTAKMFGMQTKPNFSVENEKAISTPPTVNFGDNGGQVGAAQDAADKQ